MDSYILFVSRTGEKSFKYFKKQTTWIVLLMTVVTLLFISMPIFADSDVYADQGDDLWEDEESPVDFNFTGTLEFLSLISADPDQDMSDAVKRNEIKGRSTLKYGTDTFHIYSETWLSLHLSFLDDDSPDIYSYSENWEFSKDLRISSSNSEIAFNELYLNYTMNMARFRIGNQVFDWGATSLISPTSYFNPGDWRELFFNMIREDAMLGVPSISWLGTPAVSAMVFVGDYTCEVVASPIHTPMLLPLNNGFWSVEMENDLFSVLIDEAEEMEVTLENTGVGVRLSGSFLDADVSVSAFHGPDREAVLIPYSIELQANEPVIVVARPQYRIINMVGLDFSYTHDNFGVQFEAVYSPDKHFMPDVDISMVDQDLQLPMADITSRYMQCALGVNYFVPLFKVLKGHQGVSVLYVEYSQVEKFDEAPSSALFPNLIVCGYIDSFFDNRLETSMIGAIDKESGSYVLQPQIGYNIRNNLKLKLSYTSITGKSRNDGSMIEPIFYYYRDKDVVMLKIGYTF